MVRTRQNASAAAGGAPASLARDSLGMLGRPGGSGPSKVLTPTKNVNHMKQLHAQEDVDSSSPKKRGAATGHFFGPVPPETAPRKPHDGGLRAAAPYHGAAFNAGLDPGVLIPQPFTSPQSINGIHVRRLVNGFL